MKAPRLPRDKKGNFKNFEDEMKVLKDFKNRKISIKKKTAFKQEFDNLDIKDVMKLIKEPKRGRPNNTL